MKRLLLAVICAISALCAVQAEAPTGKAAIMANQIKSYLQTEGYVPKFDDDGDLCFKSEGRTFYVVCSNWDNGVYIDFYKLVDITDYNMARVRKAANKAQSSLKFARVDIVSDSTISFDVVGYYENVSTFKAIFEDMLSIINTASERFYENYQGE